MSLTTNTWSSMSRSGRTKRSPCAGVQATPAARSTSPDARSTMDPVCSGREGPGRGVCDTGRMSQSSALSPQARDRALAAMASPDELDVLVVGGGVVGTGTALDAVTRGLSTGLLEQRDLASGTSSRSSKLVHGGLRYLEMLDFGLVREALHERGLLLTRLAPHLVRPVPFLYPLTHHVWERAYVGSGIALYDAMAMSSGGGSALPHHRHLTRRQALRLMPSLKSSALTGP